MTLTYAETTRIHWLLLMIVTWYGNTDRKYDPRKVEWPRVCGH